MNYNASQTALSLPASQPFAASRPSPLARIQSLWHDHQARAKQARAMAAFADIDTHTLRDIGAPNWVIAEASQRGDSRGLRLLDLYRS